MRYEGEKEGAGGRGGSGVPANEGEERKAGRMEGRGGGEGGTGIPGADSEEGEREKETGG